MPAWDLATSFAGALVIGVVLHVVCAFGFAWVRFIEDRIGSFQAVLMDFKQEMAGAFTTVSEQFRLPTGLSNDALGTLSRYLSNADKLYSVVYVRPSLWLSLGDLLNVFSLQAHYNHLRLDQGRRLNMVRFLIWNEQEFTSPAGIFIIRASILVGAQTRIITRGNVNEIIRRYGNPVLQTLVDRSLHVWLDCKITNNEELPQSGQYGALIDNRFAEPREMMKDSDPAESVHNFFKLIKLLNEFSLEIDQLIVPDQIKEEHMRDQISHALRKLRTDRGESETVPARRRRGAERHPTA